jgi:hypothetical protein
VFDPGKNFQPSYLFVARPESTRMMHISDAPIYSRLLALLANIRLCKEAGQGANTSVLQKFVNYDR